MMFWLTLSALALFVIAVTLVLSWHWEEFHGDNHF